MRPAPWLLLALAACDPDGVSTTSLTAADQAENPEDVAIVTAARRSLVTDGSLGIRGKNAFVIVQRGSATVRGSASGEAERRRVISIVATTPGVTSVVDRMEVP